jgi:hypothetical protein
MTKKVITDGHPDGVTLVSASTNLLSFWCGTPSTIFALTCLGATCVVASVVTKWNNFVKDARTRGFSS